MFENIINLVKGSQLERNPKYDPLFTAIEKHVRNVDRYVYSHSKMTLKGCNEYESLKKLPPPEKLDAILYLAKRVNSLQKKVRPNSYGSLTTTTFDIYNNLLDAIMRTRIDFPEDFSFFSLYELFYHQNGVSKNNINLSDRPFGSMATQIEKHVKNKGLTNRIKQEIETILRQPIVVKNMGVDNSTGYYWGPDIGKALKKFEHLLYEHDESKTHLVPPYQLGSGRFGSIVNEDIKAIDKEQQNLWNSLFHHLSTASAGKPSQKFLKASIPLVDAIGANSFKSMVNKWFSAAANLNVVEETHTNTYNGRSYNYNSYEFIESYSYNLLKGLLWSMSRFHDKQSLQTIALLTEKCFQKIPEQGPAAAGVGNAGIYTLAQSKGLAGISHLSRLKLRIRQNNTQKLIQKYIEEQAVKQGIKPAQIEEIAAPDFGLVNGELVESFNDYQLMLRMTGVGTTQLQWLKPDGQPQKSVPAFVKNSSKLSGKLKKLRDLAKQVKQSSTTQRDRIDRLYCEDMSWSVEEFEKHYLNHGLVSQIARKLIWRIDEQPALYVEGQWQNEQGLLVSISDQSVIQLWHPIHSEADMVLAWRERLEILAIKQPLKQSYREIYLLTDAEINTRIYSNRMAAHILKQHQFNSLAALRGWKYSLLGAYDDGRDGEIANRKLSEFGLTAQFWIDEIIDDTDSFNDAGIWHYVATDQVRFVDDDGQPVPLIEIPALIFSELMRDVDLFVSVASVGNDPQWQDGGPEQRQDYRDYWRSYSFGDLTEVAKTRKSVLERLLPKLKISNVARIDGKFLLIDGKINTYKIHIGSGNILIAPNDRYLCIVPGRGKDKKVEQVFLPFEGDAGFSIVLSKAFMLAEDDKITDETIVSQL